jgi:uncharacterized membrane protein YdjX (TVP38/TMEM64 family)
MQRSARSSKKKAAVADPVEKLLEATPGKALVVRASPALGRLVRGFDHLKRKRARLLHRKKRLLGARTRLLAGMPPRWRMARERRRWRHGLGAIEMRTEVALVDQFALMDRFLSPEGEIVAEAVAVDTAPNKDERWWSFVVRGEAILVRRFIRPQERFIRDLLRRQNAFIDRANGYANRKRRANPVSGALVKAALFLPILLLRLLVKLEGLLFLNVVKGQEALTGAAVSLPINVKTGFLATKEELRTEANRRKFRLSFLNERLWTPERRNALLFVFAIAAALVYVLSEVVFQLAWPSMISAKRTGDVVVLYAMATRLFLPTPFEPILISGAAKLGLVLAVTFAAIGATVGSYLLFILGSQVNQGLHIIAKKRPRLGKVLHWLEDRGRRHAYWMLGLLLAIPFSPDSLAVLGTLIRLRLSGFLLTIFLSTIIRSTIFLTLIWG